MHEPSDRFAENVKQELLPSLQKGELNVVDWMGYEDILCYKKNLLVFLKPRKTEGFNLIYSDMELGEVPIPSNLDQVKFIDVEARRKELKDLEEGLGMPGLFDGC